MGMLGMVVVLAVGCSKEAERGAADQHASGKPATTQERVESTVAKIAPAATGAGAGDFGVESAKITFRWTGQQEGLVTAWIDDHGAVVAMRYELTRPADDKRVLWKDGASTLWGKGKPYRSKLRPRDTELRLVSITDPDQLAAGGYVRKPDETIAGHACEVWRSDKMNVTLWRWQGIDLKYENGAGTDTVVQRVEATEVVSPAEVPADMLGPP